MAFSSKGITHRSTATGPSRHDRLGASARLSRWYAHPDGGRQCH